MGETSLTSRELSPESEFWPCEVFYCCEVVPAAVSGSGRWIPVGLWHRSCSHNLEGVMVFAQCRGCSSGEETDPEQQLPAPKVCIMSGSHMPQVGAQHRLVTPGGCWSRALVPADSSLAMC